MKKVDAISSIKRLHFIALICIPVFIQDVPYQEKILNDKQTDYRNLKQYLPFNLFGIFHFLPIILDGLPLVEIWLFILQQSARIVFKKTAAK